MAVIQNLTATILIQVGADEPKPIGTIEIPIEVSTGKRPGGAYRGINTGHPDDDRSGPATPAPRMRSNIDNER